MIQPLTALCSAGCATPAGSAHFHTRYAAEHPSHLWLCPYDLPSVQTLPCHTLHISTQGL